jgi:hypothetical protein
MRVTKCTFNFNPNMNGLNFNSSKNKVSSLGFQQSWDVLVGNGSY